MKSKKSSRRQNKNYKGKKSIEENYKLSWKFLKEVKNYVWVVAGIFLIFALIGFIFPAPAGLQERILEILRDLTERFEGLNLFETISYVFLNNVLASFFGIVLGILFGVISIWYAVSNGYILGFVGKIAVAEEGFLILLRLIPHGIFELPAIIISLGIGLKLGVDVFNKNRKKLLRKDFRESMRFFIFVIVPLLLIAAVIEGVLIWGLG